MLIPCVNLLLVWRLVELYKALSTNKMRLWYVVPLPMVWRLVC